MITQRLPIVAGIRHLTAHEVTEFIAGFASNGSLPVTHADGRQSRPSRGVADALGVMQDRITAILFPAVAALPCLIGVMLQAAKFLLVGVDQ